MFVSTVLYFHLSKDFMMEEKQLDTLAKNGVVEHIM